ncbi:MAG: TIGR01212 family radical SAM protein [Muribaculaceae bacterium]|nr:TIGR01212 family radical SAM protein [Muribaculaceae bacterium]
MNPWYKDYPEYLAGIWPGVKLQKISVDAGFSCPNRDGTIGRGGCIYCDNRSFTPSYCNAGESVATQLRRGKEFFSRKYPRMKYLAYFQSFTGTHSSAPDHLRSLYVEALSQPDIAGLIIGTRPDTLPAGVLEILSEINRNVPVIVEIGGETSHERTLRLSNRCHTWDQVEQAVTELHACGIRSGLHLIAGLPGESDEDVLETVRRAIRLPVGCIKMHQLQIIRDTPLHALWQRGEIDIRPYTAEEYLDLCVSIVESVDRKVAIERFVASAPPGMVVSPSWGLKNYQFVNLLHNRLRGIYGHGKSRAEMADAPDT